jgi:hypothetical protein
MEMPTSQELTLSTSSSASGLRGSTTPRIFTPPLRNLTPSTSYGFDVIEFAANVLGTPLDPWEEWLVIHAGELLRNGMPRFREVLVLVARQNGKTFLLKVLALYWLYVEELPLLIATHTTRDMAIDVWRDAYLITEENEYLDTPRISQRTGKESFTTPAGCVYKVQATNRKTGRGATTNRIVMDEIREHRNSEAYDAAIPGMNAVPNAQAWMISNQGDDKSVVLNSLRDSALMYIERGKGNRRLGLFEWSAPDGSQPTDVSALLRANPNIGNRIDIESIIGQAEAAQIKGGQELASFRTEMLCMRVHMLDPAIDPDAWAACATDKPLSLAPFRKRVALCLDVSLDGSHATLVAATVIDGKSHVEVIAAWDGFPSCTKKLREDLPGLVAKIRPAVIGWFPNGPAAGVGAALQEKKNDKIWPPRGVKVETITSEIAQVCMGLAELVTAEEVIHPHHPDNEADVLDQHILRTQKLHRGDTWVFMRKDSGSIDASYALAGAIHLARTMPAPRSKLVALSGEME